MNLKSYARGIGAGLVLAALVLGFGPTKEKLTDNEIKQRAVALGMIESSTLKEVNKDNVESIEPKVVSTTEEEKVPVVGNSLEPEPEREAEPEPEQEAEPELESGAEPESIENQKEVEEQKDSTLSAINPMPEDESGFVSEDEKVTLKVIRGDSSVSVSRRLFEAGLVESAVEFDKYLCENGYDKIISVGEYELDFSMSFEEIANKITGK